MSRGLHRSEEWLAEQQAKRHVAKPSGVPTPKPSSPDQPAFLVAKVSAATGKVGTFRKVVNKPRKVVNKSRKVSNVPTESQEQAAVIQWCDAHPVAKHIFAIPNGSHKSPAMAAKFKREGLRAGVPDLFLPVASGGFHGLFIEMKRVKGAVTSPSQADWGVLLTKNGYAWGIGWGAQDAIEFIQSYLSDLE